MHRTNPYSYSTILVGNKEQTKSLTIHSKDVKASMPGEYLALIQEFSNSVKGREIKRV